MDLVTAPLLIPPGRAISGLNYEPVRDGFRRIQGMERFDGRSRPSRTTYRYMDFITGNTQLVAGQIVTGVTSGAIGELLVDQVATSGSFGGGDAAGYLVLWVTSGTFVSGENLQVGGITRAVSASVANEYGASNDTDNATWSRAAIEAARALITAPPGTGSVRGVWMFNGTVYAWRDSGGAGAMWKSTTSGWQAVALGLTLPFTSGGTTAIVAGNTITGAISAATAVITRVVLTSGTWAGGDAAGYFVMATKTGNFVAENLNVGASLNLATIAGNATATTLPAGGRYELANYNFYAGTSGKAMYGCNGVGKAFEFDGTSFCPISSGQPVDTPIHLAVHGNRLFLAFTGGLVDCSIAGSPQVFSGILGAAEFGVGDEITGLVGDVVKTLFIFTTTQTKILTGSTVSSGADPFKMDTLNKDAGAVAWSMQEVGTLTYYDQGGVRNTTTTQKYGDFGYGTFTEMVQPLIDAKRNGGVTVTASLRSRRKVQYRVFFSDGTGLTVYLGKTKVAFGESYPVPEVMPFDLGKVVNCACSLEDSTNTERLFIGCTDGMVYELDSGTSLDGEQLDSYLRLAFDASKSLNYNKHYISVLLQVDKVSSPADGNLTSSLYLTAEFSYANPMQPAVDEQTFTLTGGGGFYDVSSWDQIYFDEAVYGEAQAYIDGIGFNISLGIRCSATYEEPHTIKGYQLNYSMRGMRR